MALAVLNPIPQFFDIDGDPLDNGRLWFGPVNNNPLTVSQTVYWDAAGTIPASQPIRTINGYPSRSGTPAIIYTTVDVSLLVQNKRGKQVFYAPNSADFGNAASILAQLTAFITSLATSIGSTLVGFIQAGAGAILRTLQAKARERVSMEDFGAVGDGVALGQQSKFALALAAVATGGVIELAPGGVYMWSASAPIGKKVTVRGNGATIKFDPAYNVSGGTLEAFSVSADDVTFDGVYFDATGAPAPSNNSRFIWSTAARTKVFGCRAINLPGLTSNVQVAFGSSIASSDFTVAFCTFDSCPGAAFSQGPRPIFAFNRVTEPKDVSFAFNSTTCVGGQAYGNNIRNAGSNVSGHILAEEGASDWQITDNTVYGVRNGTGIGAVSPSVTTIVEGGLIANNTIDGGALTSTNPTALIAVSVYYRNTQILENKLKGMTAGLASNTAITAPLLGTKIAGNRLDCSTGTSSGNAVVLTPAGGDCYYFDNETLCTTGPSRHVVVNNGNNAGGKLHVKGGRMIGAAVGIDFNLNAPTNMVLWIENLSECTATAPVSVSTAYPAFGDRQTYINTYGALGWPHSIRTRTVMYGIAVPAAGTWQTGDEVIQLSPAASTTDRWRCTAGGTPGTWKAGAALAA
jgi:hypothetical protein